MGKSYGFLNVLLALPLFLSPIASQSKPAVYSVQPNESGIILYTPYVSRSATPGEEITYNVSVINQTNGIAVVHFSFRGLPEGWDPRISSGSNTIQRIAVKPKGLGESHIRKITLHLSVPLKIDKGIYQFELLGETSNGYNYLLPIRVKVTERGTLSTIMNVKQANMQGYAGDTFNYNFILYNKTAKDQTYALISHAPPGWTTRFRVSGNYATSAKVESNSNKTIFVKVVAPANAEAGTYNIPIRASWGSSFVADTLQTAIKGKYNLNLTTSTGLLSADVTAGGKTELKLKLVNTGSLPLHNIKLTSTEPADWSVDFGTKKVTRLNPGETTFVTATVEASEKAIAGDYQLKINATTNNVAKLAKFRMTVGKSMLWGGISILIIVVVVGGIFMMVRTYGRR